MRTHSTRLAAVAVLALVATSAAACGDDDEAGGSDAGETSSSVSALSEDQLGQAVLQPDNLGDGWTQEASEDDDSTSPGCLAEVQAITDSVDEAAKVSYDYTYGDAGVPLVSSSVSSFDDEETLTSAFEDAKDALASCDTVTGTDSDGTTYDLTLSYDDTVSEGVDDQVDLTLNGTITFNGEDATIAERITMVRLGPNVATTGMVDFGDSSAVAAFDSYRQIALDRFVAVANGEEPAATTAPAPE